MGKEESGRSVPDQGRWERDRTKGDADRRTIRRGLPLPELVHGARSEPMSKDLRSATVCEGEEVDHSIGLAEWIPSGKNSKNGSTEDSVSYVSGVISVEKDAVWSLQCTCNVYESHEHDAWTVPLGFRDCYCALCGRCATNSHITFVEVTQWCTRITRICSSCAQRRQEDSHDGR